MMDSLNCDSDDGNEYQYEDQQLDNAQIHGSIAEKN